ncbi:MAG: alanine--tRNA ligase, partial [Acholeplasmataceae bacterium]|nr:alanine--tRNA ligase [Acholeplasmataceae bacterium]
YGEKNQTDMAIRVITDHIRSTTMMISDGVVPTNEDRGYVLRRLLRRAARYGRLIGLDQPFLHRLVPTVIEESVEAYPDLAANQARIVRIVRQEEERFLQTIHQGGQILDQMIAASKQNKQTALSGQEVFRLHDTFGFPFDLTREIAGEQGLSVDEAGFQDEMNRQKEAARQAFIQKTGSAWDRGALPAALKDLKATRFTGYDTLSDQGTVLALVRQGPGEEAQSVQEAGAGETVTVIVDQTPFYAEAGGQVGDEGQISAAGFSLTVQQTIQTPEGLILHVGQVEDGVLHQGDRVTLQVDREKRLATARNHTTTHLLQRALRSVLGEHVTQAGSLVAPERFRFDFNHF